MKGGGKWRDGGQEREHSVLSLEQTTLKRACVSRSGSPLVTSVAATLAPAAIISCLVAEPPGVQLYPPPGPLSRLNAAGQLDEACSLLPAGICHIGYSASWDGTGFKSRNSYRDSCFLIGCSREPLRPELFECGGTEQSGGEGWQECS